MTGPATCAACPVMQGECPVCGTFWIFKPWEGKRIGIRPVDRPALTAIQPDGSTVSLPPLQRWPNVMVTREAGT